MIIYQQLQKLKSDNIAQVRGSLSMHIITELALDGYVISRESEQEIGIIFP